MLVAFDFDGTLTRTDPFVELGERHGAGDDVAATLDRMTGGDLSFERGLRSVADHLEGMPTAEADAALEAVRVDSAAAELVGDLQRADHHVAVITDAPERAVESCLAPDEFDPDTVVANRFPTAQDALTGDIEGPLVDRSKADALEELATNQDRPLSDTVALGTDRRDLPMLQAAGTGIAVDPIPVVESEADRVVPSLQRAREWFDEENMI